MFTGENPHLTKVNSGFHFYYFVLILYSLVYDCNAKRSIMFLNTKIMEKIL